MQMPELHWSMLIGALGVLAGLCFVVLVTLTLIRGEVTVAQRSARRHTLLVLGPLSVLLVAVALVMYVFVRPVEISSAARDETILLFLDAVRRDDGAGLRAVTAPGFPSDSSFLRDHVRTSARYEQGNSNISSNDDQSCVRGMLFPARVKIVMRLVKQRDRWLIESAAMTDPCERGLRR